jgi:hypothetical protein
METNKNFRQNITWKIAMRSGVRGFPKLFPMEAITVHNQIPPNKQDGQTRGQQTNVHEQVEMHSP